MDITSHYRLLQDLQCQPIFPLNELAQLYHF
nr:MAG TPA: hypothetical protein [Caudoviricetes sp.]